MKIINSVYIIFVFISASLPSFKGKSIAHSIPSKKKRKFSINSFCFRSVAELGKNLHFYESIHADDIVHRIVKRGTKQSYHPFNVIKEVEFKALGRHFRIILHPQRDVLHSNFKAYSVDGDGNEKVVHFGEFDCHSINSLEKYMKLH